MSTQTTQPLSKTFAGAALLLGGIAVVQLVAAFWIFATEAAKREQSQAMLVSQPASAGNPYAPFMATLGTPMQETPAQMAEAYSLAQPTPINRSGERPQPQMIGMFEELLQQARVLREKGDMAAALTKLREAQAMNPQSPEVISELAGTYEAMGLVDKAIEQWQRVVQLGPEAGILFSMAQMKIQEGVDIPESVDVGVPETEFAEGADLALAPIQLEEDYDPNYARTLRLQVPIQVREGVPIFEDDVVIQVFFYDLVDDMHVVQTSALREYEWLTPPADWRDDGMEVLQVLYRLPFLTQEDADAGVLKRDYLGYAARLYYQGELQATAADPVRLLREYPAPANLDPVDPSRPAEQVLPAQPVRPLTQQPRAEEAPVEDGAAEEAIETEMIEVEGLALMFSTDETVLDGFATDETLLTAFYTDETVENLPADETPGSPSDAAESSPEDSPAEE